MITSNAILFWLGFTSVLGTWEIAKTGKRSTSEKIKRDAEKYSRK